MPSCLVPSAQVPSPLTEKVFSRRVCASQQCKKAAEHASLSCFCTTCGVGKAYETFERRIVKIKQKPAVKKTGLDEEETVLKYCPVLTGEREMLHQHVRSLVNSGSLADVKNYAFKEHHKS